MFTTFRVGLFVFMALLFLSVGVFLIGSKDFLFGSRYQLKSDFRNVEGLNKGADVRVGGIHEGTVKEIDLPSQPDGKLTVIMDLRSSTNRIIKKDSVASIKTEGLLGDKYVEISFGSAKANPVQNGDTIEGEQPKDMSQQVQTVADAAQEATTAARDDLQALQHNFLLRGFFNKRGYDDPTELKQHAVARVPEGPRSREFDYDTEKLFNGSDNAKLRDRRSLDKAGRYLEENSFGLAVVACSEAKGDTQSDRVLSEAQAKVVRDYLAQNFKLDDTRLKTIGLGKVKDAESSKLAILVYADKKPEPSVQNAQP